MQQDYEPQIIELEPEKAPRTSAIILLLSGLLGVGFLMVNVVFTGEDPYHNGWWPEKEEEGALQEQFNVLPNVWRGHEEDDEEEEVGEHVQARKGSKPATSPVQRPGFEPYMKRPTLTAPQPVKPPGAKPGTPVGPAPGAPPGRAAPGAPAPAK